MDVSVQHTTTRAVVYMDGSLAHGPVREDVTRRAGGAAEWTISATRASSRTAHAPTLAFESTCCSDCFQVQLVIYAPLLHLVFYPLSSSSEPNRGPRLGYEISPRCWCGPRAHRSRTIPTKPLVDTTPPHQHALHSEPDCTPTVRATPRHNSRAAHSSSLLSSLACRADVPLIRSWLQSGADSPWYP